MKKLFFLIVAMVALAFVPTACDSDNGGGGIEDESHIIGTWNLTRVEGWDEVQWEGQDPIRDTFTGHDEGEEITWRFKTENTCLIRETDNNGDTWEEEIIWRLSGNRLYLTTEDDGEYETYYSVISLNSTDMVLEYTYEEVAEPDGENGFTHGIERGYGKIFFRKI